MSRNVGILLVDDDDRFREEVSDLLERVDDGLSVTPVEGADAALERLDDGGFDCVVSDHRMPGRNGVELARAVREDHPRLPFVLVTGQGSEETASEAFSAGASEYFRKDTDLEVWVRRIRGLVERSRAERSLREAKERYEALTEESSALIAVVAPDGEITYLSESFRRVLGLDPGDVIGANVLDRVHPEDRTHVRAALYALSAADEALSRDLEVRIRDANGDWRWLASTARTTDAETIDGFVVNSRDVTERRRRETSIRTLHDATREMTTATDREAIESVVVDAASDVLGLELAGVFRYDESGGRLVPREWSDDVERAMGTPPTFDRGEGLGWTAFANGESLVFDDVSESENAYNPDTSVASELIVPIGTHGVFISGGHDRAAFDEFDAEAAEILCANADAALSGLDRESRLREREAALDRRMAELRQVTHVLGVARSALRAQFGADSRRRVEELSCDHLAAADAYRFAWVGRADAGDALEPVAASGVEDAFARGLDREIRDDPEITPGARAAATGSVVVVPDAVAASADGGRREDALERGYRSIAGVPIRHDGVTYGALEVYASEADRFDDRERSVLADLGRGLGYAIAAIDDRTTAPDHLGVEATYRIEGETLFHWQLATDLGCRVIHRGIAGIDDDEATVFVEAAGTDPDAVRSAADAADVRDLRIVSEDPVVAEARTAAPLALSPVSDHGGRLRSLSVDGGVGELTVAFPERSSVRAVAEALERRADGVELAACETIDEDPVGISNPRADLLAALTDRQRELLQAAYVGGYFERSREISGEDLAASFDLNHSTVYEHLRAGQRAVLGELFDPDD